jgi:cold shock CspA family protein
MSSESATPDAQSTPKRYVGQVKWFNNKAGYGFITMTNEEGTDSDIFTHYTTVQVKDSQYKYLVQGEYVEFELTDSTNTQHQYQATQVTGIQGGKLMCETRQANRGSGVRPSNRYRRAVDGNGPSDGEHDGFVKVQRKRVLRRRPQGGPSKQENNGNMESV